MNLCGSGSTALCSDLQTSAQHCGACGKKCSLGIACASGQCRQYRCQGKVTMREVAGPPGRAAPQVMALGDLDGDGILDLVGPGPDEPPFPPPSGASGGVYLGKGNGTFDTKASLPVGHPPDPSSWYVAVGDLNQDGILDLVTTSLVANAVDVRLGVGDGSFLPTITLPMGGGTAGIVVADFDGDGRSDIAVALYDASAVAVRFGLGNGSFAEPRPLPLVGSPYYLAVVDWDNDGTQDLVATDDYLHILRGLPGGSFAPALDCGIAISFNSKGGHPPMGAMADFDQDGHMDLAIGNGVLFGTTGCSFVRRFDYEDVWPLATADFDGDGFPDLVVTSSEIELLAADGAGGFAEPIHLAGNDSQGGAHAAVSGDLNGDGRLDLVVAGNAAVRVLLNTCP
jgi:hypothetical protein